MYSIIKYIPFFSKSTVVLLLYLSACIFRQHISNIFEDIKTYNINTNTTCFKLDLDIIKLHILCKSDIYKLFIFC